jgi:hypothetical protein
MNANAARGAGFLFVLLAGTVVTGCVSDPYYSYPAYLTDDAVIVERQLAERGLGSVRPVATPVRGSVAVDLPTSRLICVATDICESQDLSSYERSVALEQEKVRYRSMAEALIRARAFESVAIAEDCDAGVPTVATDWTIRVTQQRGGAATWFLFRNATGRSEVIQFDAAATPAVRMSGWVDAVVATAGRMAAEQPVDPAVSRTPVGWEAAGCKSNRYVKHPWRVADVLDVALAQDEWLRTETLNLHPNDAGEVHALPWSGPAWTGIFAGGPQSAATFRIDSTRVFVDYVGFAAHQQYHYVYDGTVTWNGRSQPLRGEAISEVTEYDHSMDVVVLDTIRAAVADAARQVRAIMGAVPARRN